MPEETRPLAIDLFCGLGGWTEGLLAAGYRVVGFDIERHVYGAHAYPAQLVLQDVRTLHGRQFRDAALIVASPPCQAYSYMAMPWSRAKQMAREYEDGTRDRAVLTELFDACFRIQREACEAAGRHVPLVVENVRGAQRWVGRARWHFGSFYLWGDVPALMPVASGIKLGDYGGTGRFPPGGLAQGAIDRGVKVATMGAGWYPPGHPKHVPGLAFNTHAEKATKNSGGSWFGIERGQRNAGRNDPRDEGRKHEGSGPIWFDTGPASLSSRSPARKAASALIAKIPLTLSRHIAEACHPART